MDLHDRRYHGPLFRRPALSRQGAFAQHRACQCRLWRVENRAAVVGITAGFLVDRFRAKKILFFLVVANRYFYRIGWRQRLTMDKSLSVSPGECCGGVSSYLARCNLENV